MPVADLSAQADALLTRAIERLTLRLQELQRSSTVDEASAAQTGSRTAVARLHLPAPGPTMLNSFGGVAPIKFSTK